MTEPPRGGRAPIAGERGGGWSGHVRDVFDANAGHYDRVNTVITFGRDAGWREWAARSAAAAAGPRPARVLDACAGTGLIGLQAAALGADVTLLDASDGMLAVARGRAARRGLVVEVAAGDLDDPAAPLPADPFDAVTLGFGLRYFADPAAALQRLVALLRPGGRLVVLEAVVPPAGIAHRLASRYFFTVAPRAAAGLAGGGALYRLLTDSVRSLGSAVDVLALVRGAGLTVVERRDFAAGLVVGVVAEKPAAPSPAG